MPRTVIVEQPAGKTIRFRYKCEGNRSAGSIPGVNSTSKAKTFPSIRVEGYEGQAVVLVSLVAKEEPKWTHPHNLIGGKADNGVLKLKFLADSSSIVSFKSLGIQCTQRKDIDKSLEIREKFNIDPFNIGYDHRKNPKSINLNVVRLCFQVFISNDVGECIIPLKPISSDPIYDIKSKNDLIIHDLSDTSSSVKGGKKIILLCEKVSKDNIKVRFYEEINEKIAWEAFGEFTHKMVYRQFSITFNTPPYKKIDIDYNVSVFIQLQRPSDGMTSEPLKFYYTPDDVVMLKRKKLQKLHHSRLESFKYPPVEMQMSEAAETGADFSHQMMSEMGGLTINGPPSTIDWASIPTTSGGHQHWPPILKTIPETTESIFMDSASNTLTFGGHQSTYGKSAISEPINENSKTLTFGGHQSICAVPAISEPITETAESSFIDSAFGGHQSTYGMSAISKAANETTESTSVDCGSTTLQVQQNITTASNEIEMNSSSNLNSLDEIMSDELHSPINSTDFLALALELSSPHDEPYQNQIPNNDENWWQR